jgi:hypothetical protein
VEPNFFDSLNRNNKYSTHSKEILRIEFLFLIPPKLNLKGNSGSHKYCLTRQKHVDVKRYKIIKYSHADADIIG